MSLLLETIQIKNGRILNLQYHNERFNRSRREVHSCQAPLDLSDYILVPKLLQKKCLKCRILYSSVVHRVEYAEYHPKYIKSLQVVRVKHLDYSYKYEDRSVITNLMESRNNCDDILIIQDGYITDTSYCNVALLKDATWYTPKHPLLQGTQRASLIDLKQIIVADISIESLDSYQSIRLFNSMLAFGQVELSTTDIII